MFNVPEMFKFLIAIGYEQNNSNCLQIALIGYVMLCAACASIFYNRIKHANKTELNSECIRSFVLLKML
jgi:hypothetical protein